MCNKIAVSARKPNAWGSKEPLMTVRLLFNPIRSSESSSVYGSVSGHNTLGLQLIAGSH